MNKTPTKPIHVLLVEDNPADADLMRETLGERGMFDQLTVAVDGQEAMNFLYASSEGDSQLPDLILLDLNLPRKSGKEVLAEVRADKLLRRIPVVILTSSDARNDVVKSYELGANCYIKKPLEFVRFQMVVRSIEDFWLTIIRLPN